VQTEWSFLWGAGLKTGDDVKISWVIMSLLLATGLVAGLVIALAITFPKQSISIVNKEAEPMQLSKIQSPHIVMGNLHSRDINALKAKYEVQDQIKTLSLCATQSGGKLIVGKIKCVLDKKSDQNRKKAKFVIHQQIEIHLPRKTN